MEVMCIYIFLASFFSLGILITLLCWKSNLKCNNNTMDANVQTETSLTCIVINPDYNVQLF